MLERVCWCLTLYVLLHVAILHFVYISKNIHELTAVLCMMYCCQLDLFLYLYMS